MQTSQLFKSFILCSVLLLGANSVLSQKLQDNSNGHPFAAKLLRHLPISESSVQFQAFEKELRAIPSKVAQFKAQAVASSKNHLPNVSVQSAAEAKSSIGGPMRVVFDGDHQTPIFIEGPRQQNLSTMNIRKLSNEAVAQAGMDFLIANAGLLRVENPAQEFELIDTDREDAGFTHLRYQQKYQGLEVWGQDIRVHLNADGSFESFNGRYISTPKSLANYKTVVDEQAAVQIAQQQLGTGASETTSRKVIYVDGNGKARVAWLVQSIRGLGENWYHFIDVETGVTLKRYNNVMTDGPVTGSGVDLLNQTRTLKLYQVGSTFYMIDPSKPMFSAGQSTLPQNGKGVIYTLDARSTDSLYYFVTSTSPNLWPDKATVSASANGALVYDYYYQVHGRNAIDNNGTTIYMAVHYQKNLDNAFWNGRMMVFGNGDGSVFSNLAAALDVTAHEMTHGVVASTANLLYENQSGALNESFADVFGEMCEYWAKGTCDWLIGEDVTTPGVPGDALRDMADPSSSKVAFNGQQPTNMSQYRTLPNTPGGDFGGVHTNSGITNRAFYLFATSPVVGNNSAAKVYYRALTKYLTRSAQFTDCRIAVIKSAEDLFGGPGNAVATIAGQAFDAVGISGGNSTQPPTPLPSVQGQPYLAMVGSQSGLLYRSSPDGQNVQQISTIALLGRPAPTDNGSNIFFVDKTNNLHVVSSDGSSHTQLSTTGGYNAVAISPNGRYLAATLSYQVPRIYVLDLDSINAGWKTFQLYIPIYIQGATGGSVRFPDRIDWALNNQVVMYDVYSTFVNASGNTSGFWDINLLRITDSSISRLIPPPPLGVEIGDPVFASNTDNLVAFDYIDELGQVTVRATNLFTGAVGIVTNNYSSLGNPSFSSDDKKIFYQYKPLLSDTSIYVVDLKQDGLTGSGDDKSILVHAEYPVAFTVGTRVTNVAPVAPKLASPSNGTTGLPTNPVLVWNSSSTANYYSLQVSTSQTFSSRVADQTGVVDTSYKVSGLLNNTVYYWRVSAANTVGSSPYSNVASFTTVVASPQSPTSVVPIDGAKNVPITPQLSWTKAAGASSYQLQVAVDLAFSTTVVNDSTITDTTKAIGPLQNNSVYYWRVRAKNVTGVSNWSSVKSFTTIIVRPQTPVLASPLDSAKGITTTPMLSWYGVVGAERYRVQLSTSASFGTTVVDDSLVTDSYRQVGPLMSGAIYYWRVSAINVMGSSAFSQARSLTTTIAAPQAPTLTLPADSTRNVPISPIVSWTRSAGATTYRLQVSMNPAFSTSFVNDSTITDTTRVVGPLQNNTIYYWRVSANNDGGTSAWSQVKSFTTIVAAPQAPTLAVPADSAINVQLNVTLSWIAISDAALYHLQVSATTTFGSLSVDDSTLNTTSRSIGPLSLATNYYWRVRAKNQGGWGPYSPIRRFGTIRTTSVEQVGNAIPTEYVLSQNYPNPFNPTTTIQFALPKSSNVSLKVFDALAKEVATLVTQELGPGYFTVKWQSNVPSGIYFYRLQAGEFVETKKMILLR